MTSEVENPVLEHMRKIRGTLERLENDVGDIKLRMSAVEHGLGNLQLQVAGLNSRMDRFDERLTRVERRLELHEPA